VHIVLQFNINVKLVQTTRGLLQYNKRHNLITFWAVISLLVNNVHQHQFLGRASAGRTGSNTLLFTLDGN
jgi:hypothetical protein